MFSYLDFRCYFKANAQNHIHFPPWSWGVLIKEKKKKKKKKKKKEEEEEVGDQASIEVEGVEEQMLIFSSSLTLGRAKGSWIVLIWKIPACLKLGKTSIL